MRQERHKTDYAQHVLAKEKKGFEEFRLEAVRQLEQKESALQSERAEKAQAVSMSEELSREVSVLQAKYQEEARKVHVLQETVISLKGQKRRDGQCPASPTRGPTGCLTPQRVASPVRLSRAPSPARSYSDYTSGGVRAPPSAAPPAINERKPRGPLRQPLARAAQASTSHAFNHRQPILGSGSRTSTPDARFGAPPQMGSLGNLPQLCAAPATLATARAIAAPAPVTPRPGRARSNPSRPPSATPSLTGRFGGAASSSSLFGR